MNDLWEKMRRQPTASSWHRALATQSNKSLFAIIASAPPGIPANYTHNKLPKNDAGYKANFPKWELWAYNPNSGQHWASTRKQSCNAFPYFSTLSYCYEHPEPGFNIAGNNFQGPRIIVKLSICSKSKSRLRLLRRVLKCWYRHVMYQSQRVSQKRARETLLCWSGSQ